MVRKKNTVISDVTKTLVDIESASAGKRKIFLRSAIISEASRLRFLKTFPCAASVERENSVLIRTALL